jgi:hypothetical protein
MKYINFNNTGQLYSNKIYVFSWPIKICKSHGVVLNALDDCDWLVFLSEARLCKTINLDKKKIY